jgi:serine/threonine-protein kinase
VTLIDDSDGADGELAEGELVAARYRVIRVLGRGATGTVYEAEHQWTRRRVALKVLREGLSLNERVVSRFLREARVCAELSHPSLVAVLDMGQDEHDGLLFLAQELVDGRTLRAMIDERAPMSEAEAIDVIEDIADALGVVHDAGLVHRDVKPENIIVCPPDEHGRARAKLIDFGIAREVDRDSTQTRTQLGALLGTPRYMSPEQARATGEIDARSDQYSLAVVAYECLTGRTPHEGESTPLVLASLLTQPAPAIESVRRTITEPVASAVMRALSASPAARHDSVRAFGAALRAPVARKRRGLAPMVGLGSIAALLSLGALALRPSEAKPRTTVDAAPIDAATARAEDVAVIAPSIALDATTLSALAPSPAPQRRPTPARAARVVLAQAEADSGAPAAPQVARPVVEVSTDAGEARSALRPAVFTTADASAWLRPASVR